MRIRSYKGRSLDKLYEAIREELGTDAVIVSSRKTPGGSTLLPGFMRNETYELIAVANDEATDRHLLSSFGGEEIKRLSRDQRQKWAEIEEMMKDLRSEMQTLAKTGAARSIDAVENIAHGPASSWDSRFVKALKSRCPDFFGDASDEDRESALLQLLDVEENFPVKSSKRGPHIIVLVGPTGAGKTTTAAKLAARWSLDQRLRVGLITADTFRVAAVDQIKEYSTLLGLELRVVFSAAEAGRAVSAFSNRDVVIVDTPGRAHYDHMGLTALRGVLQGMGEVTVMLTVPATWDRQQASEMIRNFKVLAPDYLVMTKIDEVRRYDVLTSVASEAGCPIAFLTNGQRVPQDLRSATRAELAGMLMPREVAV